MNKKMISLFLSALFFTSGSFAASNLQVMFNGCEPTEVISHDRSCGGSDNDPKNTACRDNTGPVRWSPLNSIASITTKAGSPGALKNCQARPNQGYYQCIITGNSGDHVAYNVTSTEGCVLDPIIIIN